ncbi:hypothetical protein CPB85DRAFT_1329380 [Mucidula mucida]|nr:hypothetical protein CPB85DRAFT_1329380 [Mucidula mucida]
MSSNIKALSVKQERKLVDYLDAQFLNMTRGYKKRSEPTAHLPTLQLYLESASTLLGLILQIPPIDPSTSLRTSYLLHLTNDVFSSATGYAPSVQNVVDLVDWLDDLDQAWLASSTPGWNPREGTGKDLVVDADDMELVRRVKSSPVSETEKTRLRSLLLGGMETFEEWLGLEEEAFQVFARTMDELGGFSGLRLETASVKESCTPATDFFEE